jgi:phosphoserine phosphatase
VAVLRGLDESALKRVYDERLRLSPGAEILLAAAKKHGIKTLLVSGGFTHVTNLLKPRLGLDYTHSNTLAVTNGKLTGELIGDIVNADGKRIESLRIRDLLGIKREQIVGIGDGAIHGRMRGQRRLSCQTDCARADHACGQLRRARLRGELV